MAITRVLMKCAACKSALEHIDVQRSPRDDAIRKTKQNMRKLLEVNLRIHGALLRVGLSPWIESRQPDTNSNQNIRSHVQATDFVFNQCYLAVMQAREVLRDSHQPVNFRRAVSFYCPCKSSSKLKWITDRSGIGRSKCQSHGVVTHRSRLFAATKSEKLRCAPTGDQLGRLLGKVD
jgi:hypothetical protein